MGTGLGLFIVRTLVKRMRGRINVRGRGAQPGSVFEVELPGHTAVPRFDIILKARPAYVT